MNAYQLAMLFMFINAGIFLVASVDVFGTDITEGSTILGWFSGSDVENSILSNSVIPGAIIGGSIVALTAAMWAGSVRIIGSSPPSPQGWAYVAFTITFWVAFLPAYDIMNAISARIDGFSVFQGVFTVAALLIFIMALIQLSTHGVKSDA